MNILTDSLSESVKLKDKQYRINSDFKTAVRILCFLKNEYSIGKKLLFILTSFYEELPESLEDAIEGIRSFYGFGDNEEKEGMAELFSFEKDSDYIFSAFYSQYGINLSQCNMHWYCFLALLKGLCGENVFSKIVSIRGMNTSEIADARLRTKYAELKSKYSLYDRLTIDDGLRMVF